MLFLLLGVYFSGLNPGNKYPVCLPSYSQLLRSAEALPLYHSLHSLSNNPVMQLNFNIRLRRDGS
jgi:hypothetical protein